MESLKEWAEYYQSLRIWVYPYNHSESQWVYWKSKNDKGYDIISKNFVWEKETTGIKMVVGKKGIRILILNKTYDYLDTVLNLLHLPSDYPWIVETQDTYGIITDSSTFPIGYEQNISYSWGVLLLEGSYVMPPSNNTIHFYKDRMPSKHPYPQVKSETLLECTKKLSEMSKPKNISFIDNIPWWKRILYYIKKLF